MPRLEINQTRHICASVRLGESAGAQVDQYAAFIHASADDIVDKAPSRDSRYRDHITRVGVDLGGI
jgi:hypothetical protein